MLDLSRRGFLKAFGAAVTVPSVVVAGFGEAAPTVAVSTLYQPVLHVWSNNRFDALAGIHNMSVAYEHELITPLFDRLSAFPDMSRANVTLQCGVPSETESILKDRFFAADNDRWRISTDNDAVEFEGFLADYKVNPGTPLIAEMTLLLSGAITFIA